jgi:hypothetical protein
MSLRTLHHAAGALYIVVFLATGAWMRSHFPDAFQGDPGMRMMFRSAHLYILLSALINLVAGAHLRLRPVRWRGILQGVGSGFLLAAPAFFTGAFFWEPAPLKLDRPFVLAGAILALTGAVLHAAARGRD